MRRLTIVAWLMAAWAAALLPLGAAAADARLPIFDAHVHYSQPAWAPFPPEKAAKTLEAAGVLRALVSSTPDDGTLALHRHDPKRFVPELRPYRAGITSSNWTRDETLAGYLEERLGRGAYAGIGEFHVFDANEVATAPVGRAIALAIARDILLHVHSDAKPIEALFARAPKLRILWAHAGMSEPAEAVDRMFARYPNLWTEISYRGGDIAPGGKLSDAWRTLFLKYPDRVLIGTDTHATGRWESYGSLIDDHRRWLAQLPPEIAKKIAYKNAVALFGSGGVAELER